MLLQVCNVGRLAGGTGACCWTVMRSLHNWQHHVVVLGPVDPEFAAAFAPWPVERWPRVSANRIAALKPRAVLLHNTPHHRRDADFPAPVVNYMHSRIAPGPANATVYCSKFLADQYGAPPESVLHQAVPRPLKTYGERDARPNARLRVGRLCTPNAAKWPDDVIDFHARLSVQFPSIDWEFVGCPTRLQSRLADACRSRAVFHPAAWIARARLWTWHALLYSNRRLPETFGRTVAEAMRAGCIPIVDDLGGFREQVTPDAGFLCGGPDDFAAALAELHDPAKRISRSQSAARHANTAFSLSRFQTQLAAQFTSVN